MRPENDDQQLKQADNFHVRLALRESEERLSLAEACAGIGLWSFDVERQI
jgi:hypothetical protein